MIRFDCACGRQLQADSKLIGSQATCPLCARVVTVPDPIPLTRHRSPAEALPAVANHKTSPSKLSAKEVVSVLAVLLLLIAFVVVEGHGPPPPGFWYGPAGVALVALGAAAWWDFIHFGRRLRDRWITRTGLTAGLCCFAVFIVAARRDATAEQELADVYTNMEPLALALRLYAKEKGHLPPAASRGPDGKLLLSWRVAVLPYLRHEAENGKLYREFHQDEPWDSPHNI
jgi:peptidoglycan/LPS O-acetylase OafA/YrhL